MMQEAFLRGLQRASGTAPAEGFRLPETLLGGTDKEGRNVTGQPTVGGEGLLELTPLARQRGGLGFPYYGGGSMFGYASRGAGRGGAGKGAGGQAHPLPGWLTEQLRLRGLDPASNNGRPWSYWTALQAVQGRPAVTLPTRQAGTQAPATPTPAAPAQPTIGDLFTRYLSRALSGADVLPSGALQGALATGIDVINRQAGRAREGLQETLGARGLLHSGVLARGLGELEEARLGDIGRLTQDFIARQLEAARTSQRAAAELFAAQQMAEAEREAAAQRQQTAIQASRPTLWDRLADLAGAAAIWYYGRPR